MSEFFFSVPFIFVLSLTLSVLLYLVGSMVSPKVKGTVGKLAPYACGEDFPARKLQVNVERFFLYIVYFMIFDILGFMLAISFSNRGLYPTLFSVIVMLALITLLPVWRGKEE